MDKRAIIVAGIILMLPIALLVIWAWQGESLEHSFAEALRTQSVSRLHRDLQGKQWTADELATIQVLKVPPSTGRERALPETLNDRGRIFVSPSRYDYQATIQDNATDIVHVFGRRRDASGGWCWDQFHPDSLQVHIRRRLDQVEQMGQQSGNIRID